MENNTKPKYGVGDKVKIVNFGHLVWESKKDKPISSFTVYKEYDNHPSEYRVVDTRPDLIGIEGLVEQVSFVQKKYIYSISNVGAWYIEDQMEMINKNPNR